MTTFFLPVTTFFLSVTTFVPSLTTFFPSVTTFFLPMTTFFQSMTTYFLPWQHFFHPWQNSSYMTKFFAVPKLFEFGRELVSSHSHACVLKMMALLGRCVFRDKCELNCQVFVQKEGESLLTSSCLACGHLAVLHEQNVPNHQTSAANSSFHVTASSHTRNNSCFILGFFIRKIQYSDDLWRI